jgi:hypothetical protein
MTAKQQHASCRIHRLESGSSGKELCGALSVSASPEPYLPGGGLRMVGDRSSSRKKPSKAIEISDLHRTAHTDTHTSTSKVPAPGVARVALRFAIDSIGCLI